MRSITIWNGDRYSLVSQGNGTAYTLIRKSDAANRLSRDVCLQGGDAILFREEWDATEAAHPDWHTDDVAAHMWGIYGEVSEAVE